MGDDAKSGLCIAKENVQTLAVVELLPPPGVPDCEVYQDASNDPSCYGYKAVKGYVRDYQVHSAFWLSSGWSKGISAPGSPLHHPHRQTIQIPYLRSRHLGLRAPRLQRQQHRGSSSLVTCA